MLSNNVLDLCAAAGEGMCQRTANRAVQGLCTAMSRLNR